MTLEYWESIKKKQLPVSVLGLDCWAAPIKSIKVEYNIIFILINRDEAMYYDEKYCKVITNPNIEIKPFTKVTAKTKKRTKK